MPRQFDNLDLLIVADPTDKLAEDVLNATHYSGRKALMVDMSEASKIFNISVSDNKPIVEPDLPLFLRVPQTPVIMRESFDKEFQYGERLSSIWAAGAMIKSPCINRPTPHGFIGRISVSVAITELRAGIASQTNEIYSRRICLPFNHTEKEWWVQDTVTDDLAKIPKRPNGQGPYRARQIDHQVNYEIVIVVGKSAYRSTSAPIKRLKLEQRSIKIMKNLGVIFGTVTWYVSSDRNTASVARVNPYPSIEEVRYAWDLAKRSLMEILLI